MRDVDDALTGLTFSRDGYLALVSSCAMPSALPDWGAWNKLQIRAAGRALKRGESPQPWTIELRDFLGWCERAGIAPCLEGLERYAAMRAGA